MMKLETITFKEVEHGIGLVKKEYLKSFLHPKQIELMKSIKKVFDPNGILNPGKIFD